MLTACEADYRGRTGYADRDYPQGETLRRLRRAAAAVDVGAIARAAREPGLIPQHIRAARVAALKAAIRI
jgi:tRNA nucleotidyltransferase (CCA-adding enzyme)